MVRRCRVSVFDHPPKHIVPWREGESGGCPASLDMGGSSGAHEPVRHLAELGHKWIAFIGGRSVQRSDPPKLSGYLEMMQRYGLPVDDQLVIQGGYIIDSGSECMQSLLDVPPPPTI